MRRIPLPPSTSWVIGNELDALHLADQRRPEIAERAAELAGERLQERVPLLLRPALVDQRDDLPVAGENVPRDMADQDEAEARDVELADLPALDAVGDDREALPQIRVLADPARTVDVAGAGLDQRAVERVDRPRSLAGLLNCGHSDSSRRWLSTRGVNRGGTIVPRTSSRQSDQLGGAAPGVA